MALQPEDERRLWRELSEHRSQDARNRLIDHYLPFSRKIARALYAKRGGLDVEFLDYVQHAAQGLIEAIDRFDVSRGVAFEAYAGTRIRGAVLNNLTAMSEKYAQISLRKRLQQERVDSLSEQVGGKPPARDSFRELADLAVGLAISYMLEGTGIVSAEKPVAAVQRDAYSHIEQDQLVDSLKQLVDALPERPRRVIVYHYYQGLSFTHIAELLGVTKGRVSQIHTQALQLIREARSATRTLDLTG
jgi:RNA polymerase sigma factor for flagellar operon FliA